MAPSPPRRAVEKSVSESSAPDPKQPTPPTFVGVRDDCEEDDDDDGGGSDRVIGCMREMAR